MNKFYLFWILIAVKHFVCDYLLQTAYLYEGKRARRSWFLPLIIHAGLNATGSGLVVLFISSHIFGAVAAFSLDFLFHSVIDRIKPRIEFETNNRTATIIDQTAHFCTHLILFFFLI